MACRVRFLVALLSISAAVPAYSQAASAPPTIWLALPRGDSLASGVTLPGGLLRRLPIDDPRQAFTLVPGVVLRGGEVGIDAVPQLSIRGSAALPSVYVDGAPVRFQIVGTQALEPAPNGIADVAITTGVAPVFVADASGGVVSYETPAGGERLAGNVRWDSDEPFGAGSTVGYNRIEGAVSGPLPVARNLTFFLAATLQGQRSSYRGMGAATQPTYLPGGVDTVVIDTTGGSSRAVTLAEWVQWSGECSAGSNAGVVCQGLRRPMDWTSARRVQGKVTYRVGAGSRLSVTGLIGDRQQRFFPGQLAAAPSLYSGERVSTLAAIANWHQPLGVWRGGPIALDVNLSLGRERGVAGLLTPESERTTRDPYLGIAFETLRFTGVDGFPLPVSDQLIRNVRTSTGLRTPLFGRDDLRNRQPYRVNPYGMLAGWPSEGQDGLLVFLSERRLQGRWTIGWRPGGGGTHHVTLGADAERTDVSFYTSALLRQAFMDLWVERPSRFGVFAGDRLALGSAVLDLGVRYDRFTPGGRFPVTPGRIYTHPRYQTTYVNAATDPAVYAAFLADTAIWTTGASHSALSPSVRFTYAVTPATSVRVGYGRSVTLPSWATYFRGVNNDLDFTNTNNVFGRDVGFASVSLVELGVRSAVTSRATLDVVGYRRAEPQYVGRLQPFSDPFNPGDTIDLNVLTVQEDPNLLGLDSKLDWRAGDWLGVSVAYSLARVHTTTAGPSGPFDLHVTAHALAGVAALRAPADWPALGRGLEVYITLRATSGLPYTRLVNQGLGTIAPGSGLAQPAAAIGASRLPWTKRLDLRVTRSLRAGGRDWTVYADLRNALNFRNTVALFAETGHVVNDQHRADIVAAEVANLRSEAAGNSALEPDGMTVNLSACATWANPVNCVALTRVERRFGDGNGMYTGLEQTIALNTYYNDFFGPWRFYGSGRTLRIGVELGL